MATLRVDDLIIPSFPPFVKDARKRISDIENYPSRKDDILLFNYPKSDKFCLQENHPVSKLDFCMVIGLNFDVEF